MKLSTLSWTTETSLSPYPLSKSFGYDSFLIDANFVQFDGFVPILKTIKVADASLEITIKFDLVEKKLSYLKTDITTIGSLKKIYDNERYLGTLVFGSGVTALIGSLGNQSTVTVNLPFLAHTVKAIPSGAGLYSIDAKYGELSFSSDNYISYDVDDNDIEFNAVAYPPASEELYLKTLNSVGPTNNNVFIKNTDIIKVTGGTSTVTISLVGSTLKGLLHSGSVIVTSDGV